MVPNKRSKSMTRINGLIALAAAVLAATAAQAQPYPAKPVRLIVPSVAGGGTDISARLIAPKMGEILGQQVVVENRAGAAMIIGGELVARAQPDGYTLLMGISTLTINPSIHKKMPFDVLRDFAPVSQVVSQPNILVVHPSVPVKTTRELIAFTRKNPNQLNYGSAGVGSNPHLTMELFLNMASIKMVHVPYKGLAPAMVDTIAGHLTVMMSTMLTGIPYARDGRLRALAVSGAQRSRVLPELPTIAESALPGYDAVQWYGVLAPAGTPREIVVKLHDAVTRTLRDAGVRERFLADGADIVGSTPEEFSAYIASETAKWARVIKSAGIKPE
jgi:tripartite-type tricarboxylate transporter receptor subunit TctC